MDANFRLTSGLGAGVLLAIFLAPSVGGIAVLLPLVTAYLFCKGWTWTVIDDGKRRKGTASA